MEDHLGKWILPALFCDHLTDKKGKRFVFDPVLIITIDNSSSGHCMITDAFSGLFQLDFTMQTGLEAVKLLLLDGFDKSATFVNSRKSALKMGNG